MFLVATFLNVSNSALTTIFLLVLLTTLPFTSASCIAPKTQVHPPLANIKRSLQYDFPLIPFPPSVDLPPQFLPPPWSPDSNLDSPYPSPIDDAGRSQMLDSDPPLWHMCPRTWFDCRRCPRDYRCRKPEWNIEEPPSTPQVSDATPNSPIPQDDGQKYCPLSKCNNKFSRCGTNARCTRGFCVCDVG